jgi:hypothetical protein
MAHIESSESAAFILRSADGQKEIAIYANGHVTGLEHAPGLTCIVNRIPAIVVSQRAKAARSIDNSWWGRRTLAIMNSAVRGRC